MKLFSKRNKKNKDSFLNRPIERRRISIIKKRLQELVNNETRIRLVSLISFLSSSDSFLEKYILIHDKPNKKFYLNGTFLDNFSRSELGYNLSSFFDFREFSIIPEKISDDEEQKMVDIYDDYFLFDLLEIIILFSKEEKREEIIERINKIFSEEDTIYNINKNIITSDIGDDLENLSKQLKDSKLQEKLNSYYKFYNSGDYINSSKISAEILNIIFSDEKIGKKKKIEKNINEFVQKIVLNNKDVNKKREELKNMFFDNLKNLQDLNNKIYNIRHTEKDRIKISNPLFYKMISEKNISIVEIFLSSLKDDYIVSENWEEIKREYIKMYEINENLYTYIPDPKDDPGYIDPEEIPF